MPEASRIPQEARLVVALQNAPKPASAYGHTDPQPSPEEDEGGIL
jgi:hypothetical protein